MKKNNSIKRCLFDAFGNSNKCDPQDDCCMWAILEGLRRLGTWAAPVDKIRARKNHKCVRKCEIKRGDLYFTDQSVIEAGRATLPRFCAGCMAMILYFKDVDNLPPSLHTHWDSETQQPVRITKEAT